jgi:hypothetical protein
MSKKKQNKASKEETKITVNFHPDTPRMFKEEVKLDPTRIRGIVKRRK